MTNERTTRLRAMLNTDGMVVAPFCLNALHAKIAESVGFKAVYMTGSGTSAEHGFSDVGLLTQTEMVANARYIANAVDVPVIADCDTGYGNAINVHRAVQEYESIGVSGIHIEDQVFPKKCGFFAGKDLIPMEEHVQKVRAALDARRDKDFVIIARTDALAVNGWEDTIRRCKAYYAAGADLVFVDRSEDKGRPGDLCPGDGRPAQGVQRRRPRGYHERGSRPGVQTHAGRLHSDGGLRCGETLHDGAARHRRHQHAAVPDGDSRPAGLAGHLRHGGEVQDQGLTLDPGA